MTLNGWLQIALFIAVVLLLAKPIGSFMTAVFERRRTFLDPVLGPLERLLYKLTGVDADAEMTWRQFLHRARMIRAMELLATGESTVTETVFECGFDSLSAFSQAFRRFTGASPAAYRKMFQRR